jgi:hypothetical protein
MNDINKKRSLDSIYSDNEIIDKHIYSIDEFTNDFFNESSEIWKSNKIRKGDYYVYKCSYINVKNGNCCSLPVLGNKEDKKDKKINKDKIINKDIYLKYRYDYCKKHLKLYKE